MNTSNPTPENQNRPAKLLYSISDACHVLSLSRRSVAYLLSTGKLKARRLGSRVFIHADTLTRFAQSDLDTLTS